MSAKPRVAVVGHVEWVAFARVPHIPGAGEIVHAQAPFAEPAGGGAVAAVQLARLAGAAVLVTALGEDWHGRRSVERLGELGVEVWAAKREAPTRTAVTLIDASRERAITTFGARLEPKADDEEIPWERLAEMDAVYFTAGDLGALRAARAARTLTCSARAMHALGHGVPLDALVWSANDEIEREHAARARGEARLAVATEGKRGGSYTERACAEAERSGSECERARAGDEDDPDAAGGKAGTWQATEPPGEPVDSYGCGDSFAAGLTFGLGRDLPAPDAIELAARCGATCLTGRGPYERQLSCVETRGFG